MRQRIWNGVILGAVVLGVAATASGQDTTTLLTQFLSGLRSGYVRFAPQAADPTGIAEGAVYYNDTANTLKVYNGSTWANAGGVTGSSSLNDALCSDGSSNVQACDSANIAKVLFGSSPAVKTGVAVQMTGVTFANLGTPGNGFIAYCSDCTIANPCASGGSGALAKRLNATWICN